MQMHFTAAIVSAYAQESQGVSGLFCAAKDGLLGARRHRIAQAFLGYLRVCFRARNRTSREQF